MNPDDMTISVSTLDEAAVATHEMFMAHVRAGFSEKQALRIVLEQLRTAHQCPDHQQQD